MHDHFDRHAELKGNILRNLTCPSKRVYCASLIDVTVSAPLMFSTWNFTASPALTVNGSISAKCPRPPCPVRSNRSEELRTESRTELAAAVRRFGFGGRRLWPSSAVGQRRFFVDLLAEPQHHQDARPAPDDVHAGLLGEFDRGVAFGPGLHPDMADP